MDSPQLDFRIYNDVIVEDNNVLVCTQKQLNYSKISEKLNFLKLVLNQKQYFLKEILVKYYLCIVDSVNEKFLVFCSVKSEYFHCSLTVGHQIKFKSFRVYEQLRNNCGKTFEIITPRAAECFQIFLNEIHFSNIKKPKKKSVQSEIIFFVNNTT